MDGIVTARKGRSINILEPDRARMEQLAGWFASEHDGLLRFAYFVCRDRHGAEDLVQEAFVRLYRAGARAEHDGVTSYARRTIVNLARSGHRRRAVAARALVERPGAAEQPDVAARDEVWRAMQELSPQQRAVIALKFYEDLPEREVAAVLGVGVGSVKKQTDRAMTKLRAILGRES